MKEFNVEGDRVKIIALTAYTTHMFKNKCFESGMDEFLTKPVSAERISDLI